MVLLTVVIAVILVAAIFSATFFGLIATEGSAIVPPIPPTPPSTGCALIDYIDKGEYDLSSFSCASVTYQYGGAQRLVTFAMGSADNTFVFSSPFVGQVYPNQNIQTSNTSDLLNINSTGIQSLNNVQTFFFSSSGSFPSNAVFNGGEIDFCQTATINVAGLSSVSFDWSNYQCAYILIEGLGISTLTQLLMYGNDSTYDFSLTGEASGSVTPSQTYFFEQVTTPGESSLLFEADPPGFLQETIFFFSYSQAFPTKTQFSYVA